jgi:hypothetical protein
MGDYDQRKFETALAKLGNPWSIVEHGLIIKAYPSCGYTHRLLNATIDLHTRLPTGAPAKSMDAAVRRAKFDQCLESLKTPAARDELWAILSNIEQVGDLRSCQEF